MVVTTENGFLLQTLSRFCPAAAAALDPYHIGAAVEMINNWGIVFNASEYNTLLSSYLHAMLHLLSKMMREKQTQIKTQLIIYLATFFVLDKVERKKCSRVAFATENVEDLFFPTCHSGYKSFIYPINL